ncbi:hypothetical protein M422DRAFT_256314 [Sphaerobolus stellatus SS14]|uniref:Uncharacterized protein n=1 Tax=Sphaerobolus stellatus (strain SS14) TaxID=990650 RepID=A0A0C9UBX7_SPHS4|nr:hypothetical protein M422DRAFT_256314 [Sphaerobolus stellatus SS14]
MQHLISLFTKYNHCLQWLGYNVTVIVTFTVSWYKWRKPEQEKANGRDGSVLASAQKKAAEGYRMAVSLNIQNVILIEASEEHIMETVPITNPVDEPELT